MRATRLNVENYRAAVNSEIEALTIQIAKVSSTVGALKAQRHETAEAYQELERMRGRLDLLKRICGPQA